MAYDEFVLVDCSLMATKYKWARASQSDREIVEDRSIEQKGIELKNEEGER